MIIECDGCAMQHTAACDDCIVTALLGDASGSGESMIELDDAESAALHHLAAAGLVAPLRLVPLGIEEQTGDADVAAG